MQTNIIGSWNSLQDEVVTTNNILNKNAYRLQKRRGHSEAAVICIYSYIYVHVTNNFDTKQKHLARVQKKTRPIRSSSYLIIHATIKVLISAKAKN